MHTRGWGSFFAGHSQATIELRQPQFMAEN